MPEIPVLLFPVVGVVAALCLVGLVFARYYVKARPNEVVVFSGRKGQRNIIRGGGRLRIPVFEQYDRMSLEPFDIEVKVENVFSTNNVPVNVTAVGLVKPGSEDEAITTAVERWLTKDRSELHRHVSEIMAGGMRSIVSQMTIEDLNSKRDELTKRIVDEAAASFGAIGMQLDVLTVQSISDSNGYLDALGRTRIAEVRKDAEVGEANAKRDAMIASAEADREGKTAEAVAATAVAQAERERDIELARISATVNGERATAEQAGPLAEAEARRAVVIAETTVEREREQAQIAVEEQRALRAEQAQRADVIVPAEARKQAAVIDAEAERDAAKLEGEGEAAKRTALAEATKNEMVAEAEGEAARLKAQAEGQRELADALNAFSTEAQRLQVLPSIIEQLPKMAEAIAAQFAQIDRLVVIDGGNGGNGDGSDMMSRLVSTVPVAMAQTMEVIRATTGVDLTQVVKQTNGDTSTSDTTAATSVETPAVAAPVVAEEESATK